MQHIEKFRYTFKGKIWKYQGKGGWYFVTIPKALAKKIRDVHYVSEEGWGRLKTSATINTTTWSTSIWYDTKIGSYIIPVKAIVRKSESLTDGSLVKIDLVFSLDKWFSNLI
ncbi:DUF1905 domain-containing protein [Bacteriovorax sp. Seq25_V]|uniref:DUF1905 domain-containing protein n=1 Tax=Bacteriovorax sp. Seq25_V TaxID=1201288 RepID=UPI000699218B|nr:DUF1905 domain-containing protein [Bacteriovorax sp. Seq25_V]